MTTIVVLGAEGFLGRHFSRYAETARLGPEPTRLIRVDRHIEPGPGRQPFDVSDEQRLHDFLLSIKPDVVVNLVAVGGDDDVLLEALNVEMPTRLMDMVAQSPALRGTKLLLIGSAAEYGSHPVLPYTEDTPLNPVTAYGRSKQRQYERFVDVASMSDLCVFLARPFNIVGPGMPSHLSLPTFAERVRKAPPNGRLAAGNLSAIRDFLDVDDVVTGFWAILARGRLRQVYNVCSGVGTPMRNLLRTMVSLSGKALTIDENHAADPGIAISIGTAQKLTRDTGWLPRWTLEQSLGRLLRAE